MRGMKGAPVDVLSQYEWWQESNMPLLPGAFSTFGASMQPVLSEIDTQIHKQIRELNRKLGWPEEEPDDIFE